MKKIVFEKVALECQDHSTQTQLLSLLINQESNSDVETSFIFFKTNSLLQVNCSRIQSCRKNERCIVEQNWDWLSGLVRTTSNFCHFWFREIQLNGWKLTCLNPIFQQKNKTKNWDREQRTEVSIFGEKLVWKSRWVQLTTIIELLAIPGIQCRIKVDSVFLPNIPPRVQSFRLRLLVE